MDGENGSCGCDDRQHGAAGLGGIAQDEDEHDIPPGIGSPDKVETRLGTLKFFDGFPDKATVEKLYDNLDFQRAVQAYLLALPPVSQVANRKAILEAGAGQHDRADLRDN